LDIEPDFVALRANIQARKGVQDFEFTSLVGMSSSFVLYSIDAMSLKVPLKRQTLGCLLALNQGGD
jgi:hypothetical protein